MTQRELRNNQEDCGAGVPERYGQPVRGIAGAERLVCGPRAHARAAGHRLPLHSMGGGAFDGERHLSGAA